MEDNYLINSDQQIAPKHAFSIGRKSIIKPVVEQKICALCDEQIDITDYPEHIANCIGPENTLPDASLSSIQQLSVYDEPTNDYSEHAASSIGPENTPPDPLLSPIQQVSVYHEPTNDYPEHAASSTGPENLIPDASLSSIQQLSVYDEPTNDYSEHAASSIGPENILPDPLLSPIQQVSVYHEPTNDYPEHAASSTGPENTLPDASLSSIQQLSVYDEPTNDYSEHAASSIGPENTLPDASLSSIQQSVVYNEPNDDSALHFQPVADVDDDDEDSNDVFLTPDKGSPVTIDENPKKYCILCYNMIEESKFVEHMSCCSDPVPMTLPIDIKSKVYPRKPRFSPDYDEDSIADLEQMKNCIICFKPIKESEYVAHVHACLSDSPTTETMKKQIATCFLCHRSVDTKDNFSQEISCPSHHIYCLQCLQHSMEEFARKRLVPLCHPTLCDYELSRHDISLIPLQRRISDRLLKLAKGQQRPQCPKCHFYININEDEDYYNHVDVCIEVFPCEYCSCPYSIDQLRNHTKQCRSDKTSRNDKLVDFIITRTKYPFTKEQINAFIQEKKKEYYCDLDPLSIIHALVVYGPIFPCDMPTRECDVCMESCLYEDIYVFDCLDSHKLCYSCYYKSCETKMSNGEILTCGLCTNPLKDSELNQLRISDEQIKKFRDYQMRKIFDQYSNNTRGVIKCPNQNCSWMGEADDPNQRFKVQCPLCKKEFCSLCNQQYHYRTKCQQLPQITQQWYLWCQTERTRYLTMRAKQDADYAARLNEYNRQINENDSRNRDLRRRYEELMSDEQYKAQNCRLCPSCNRVVQRIEGCDKMICGQDAHGGNVQSGCGTKFNWIQAKPYTVTSTFQHEQSAIDLPKPENPIVKHIGVKCDKCKNDVIGIRFDCVNCPTLTFCEKCEQRETLIHSKQNQLVKQPSHVFRLTMTLEEEAS